MVVRRPVGRGAFFACDVSLELSESSGYSELPGLRATRPPDSMVTSYVERGLPRVLKRSVVDAVIVEELTCRSIVRELNESAMEREKVPRS